MASKKLEIEKIENGEDVFAFSPISSSRNHVLHITFPELVLAGRRLLTTLEFFLQTNPLLGWVSGEKQQNKKCGADCHQEQDHENEKQHEHQQKPTKSLKDLVCLLSEQISAAPLIAANTEYICHPARSGAGLRRFSHMHLMSRSVGHRWLTFIAEILVVWLPRTLKVDSSVFSDPSWPLLGF
ncbi:hypothetical protein Ancab_019244 [Ancistrocladus abbreviatus]